MLATQSDSATMQELQQRLVNARERTDELFSLVKADALYERPIAERHRIIFYIGHLEAFDWNLLGERVLGLKSFHPEFDRLFAFGIDPVGGGLPDDPPSAWPPVKQVYEYATRLREIVDKSVASGPIDSNLPDFPLATLLNVATEHRLMHAETLAYMLHQLPLEKKILRATTEHLSAPPVELRMLNIPAGAATLGQSRKHEKFGWDNEFEAVNINVPAFAIDQYKVTNRQYLNFVSGGGYETPALWSEDDWKWRIAQNISHPIFWKRDGEQWLYRGMFAYMPLPANAPVYVSHAEAKAFARWAGKELPTEAEWHRAAYGNENGTEPADPELYPWGDADPGPRFGNFDFAQWDPTPVNAFPEGNSAFGIGDLIGNGWEWTSTPFSPLPGFQPFPFYRGYSADFFDGKHFVMKGGSARTAACMLRRSFRNWFQSHYQYAYAGFRCVQR